MDSMGQFGIDKAKIDLLKQFVKLCKFNSSILNDPALDFFKSWLVNDLGANIPGVSGSKKDDDDDLPSYAEAARSSKNEEPKEEEKSSSSSESDEEIEELELDLSGVIKDDEVPSQDMGVDKKETSEADSDQAMSMRGKGMAALSEGNHEEAIKLFTDGIKLDNSKTVLFVKRATAFVRLQRPNAAIQDCKKALEINPDSAAAYKILGKAEKLLGNWDVACRHFEEAQKIDYDDEIAEQIRDIKPVATKIREHKMAVERQRKEKEMRDRVKRVKKAKKAQEKAKAEQEKRQKEAGGSGGPNMFNFAGGMPNFAGGMPNFSGAGGENQFNFEEFMKKHGGNMAGAFPGGFPPSQEQPPTENDCDLD